MPEKETLKARLNYLGNFIRICTEMDWDVVFKKNIYIYRRDEDRRTEPGRNAKWMQRQMKM